MSITATMPQSSTSQPDLWKPRYAAKQHQQQNSQQPIARAKSLREPFDAAELTRKLESYRQELKLERARRELAEKRKTEKKTGSEDVTTATKTASTSASTTAAAAAAAAAAAVMGPPAQKKKEPSPQRQPSQPSSSTSVSRSKSLNISKKLDTENVPERKRSIMHPLRRRQDSKEEEAPSVPAEPATPYVPRVAARQFKSTTTPLKDKEAKEKKKRERKEESTSPARDSERKDSKDSRVKETKPKESRSKSKSRDPNPTHKLDWSEPKFFAKPASPPLAPHETPAAIDEETKQNRIQAMQTFNAASKPRPRPLSTALEDFRIWDNELDPKSNPYAFNPSQNQNQDHAHHDSPPQHEESASPIRPQLKQSDRHDWSQASQCGDSARQSLHLFPIKGRRKDLAGENAEIAGLIAAKEAGKRKPRQKSHGDQPNDRLVADAVKLIREEKRKSSILGMFKRH